MSEAFAIVVDIGKTMSKVTLWSRAGTLLDRQVRPNAVVEQDGLRRLDVAAIGDWLIATLARHAGQPVEYLIPVGHGAGVVGLRDGALAFAPLDYEQAIPEAVRAAYRRQRDPFAITGSTALPDGLNLAAQLDWLEARDRAALDGATLLPWAQYWAWFLSGRAVSEVTSLGCHSDLWNPAAQAFAPMAVRRGWADRFAPLAAAGDAIGTLRPELAARTGLPATAKVLAGLHDSNAALLAARGFAEIAENEATVLSTGTWFVAMRSPARHAAEPVALADLPEARDCLVNVDVHGRSVPSARFMGGREIETLIEFDTRRIDITPDQPALLAAVPAVLAAGAMMLPTLAPGCGPFPDARPRWIAEPDDPFARRAAASLYAALVADASLDLIGARERLLVEGRFAEAQVFVRALASLRPETAVYTANAHNDVSFGALRLVDPRLRPQGSLARVAPLAGDLAAYSARWRAAIAA
ncbi:FGGY-family carbohydrate kinase [Novosphingobium sp. JCM 18896]|uniref:FGGY-family carbohydrate kinase n=1 Tax=Novosphingobium sp. JCM 18896 TaxID=2989731 RepID=UPI002221CDDA|nr:carbohydrate kinase [Novosphingobium sp. JCM 18896]MCW1429486.1 carbohydrate kinase [Novosphingobium sp. JCM 18896]